MTFRQRLFFVVSVVAIVTGGTISWVALRASIAHMEDRFIATYGTLGEAVSGGFAESERVSNVLLQNAAAAFARQAGQGPNGLISHPSLLALAKSLQVETLNVFSASTGEALLLSVPQDMASAMNAFDLCPDYANLAAQERPTVTAFLPNFTGKPAKFAMSLSADGRFIVNAGMYQAPATEFLRRATAHDKNIQSTRLLAPNGQVALTLGESASAAPTASEPWYGYRLSRDSAMFSFLIPSASGVCCECVQKGLISTSGPYFYRLEMDVSTASLRDAIKHQITLAVATFITVCFVALALGCWLLSRVTAGVRAIAATADEVVAKRGWDIKAPSQQTADDVGKLALAFNRMLDALKDQEADKLEAERMRCKANIGMQVAHDIRAPLAALGVAYSDARDLPPERRRLVAGAIARIESIARNLLQAHGTAQAVGTTSRDGVRAVHVSPIVKQVVREFLVTVGAPVEIMCHISEDVCARVDEVAFACIFSSLLRKIVVTDAGNRSARVIVRYADDAVCVLLESGTSISPKARRGTDHGQLEVDVGVTQALQTVIARGGSLSFKPLPDSGVSIKMVLPCGSVVSDGGWQPRSAAKSMSQLN